MHYTIQVSATQLEPVQRGWLAWWPWGRLIKAPVTRTIYVQHVESLDVAALVAVVNPQREAEQPAQSARLRIKEVK